MSDWCSERSFRRALDESQNSQSWKNLSQYDPYPPWRRAALKMPRRAVWSASNLYFLVLIRLIGEDRNSEFVGLPKSNAGLPTERATSSRPRSTSSREVVAGNQLEACLRNLRSCPAFARLSTSQSARTVELGWAISVGAAGSVTPPRLGRPIEARSASRLFASTRGTGAALLVSTGGFGMVATISTLSITRPAMPIGTTTLATRRGLTTFQPEPVSSRKIGQKSASWNILLRRAG